MKQPVEIETSFGVVVASGQALVDAIRALMTGEEARVATSDDRAAAVG